MGFYLLKLTISLGFLLKLIALLHGVLLITLNIKLNFIFALVTLKLDKIYPAAFYTRTYYGSVTILMYLPFGELYHFLGSVAIARI